MASVDDKVVAMSFENSKFESGVSKTMSTLDKLKAALKFDGASKGLSDLEGASQKVSLSHIASAVDSIKEKFSNLKIIGLQVLANLATKAISAGASMVKQFTVAPVLDGLHEYENQLNSVQTILANTASAGTKMKDVNKALNQLNHYADKTIFNFGQMTKNIGTFTAAGVDLKTSVAAIKGISNLAALSGSNAEQASTAMYQLSQAISAGKVGLQDWNSVVNAGMGGAVFQRALANTAEKMGTLSKGAVTLKGKMKNVTIQGQSFRESITAKPGEKSWLTSDVLTNTLKQFTGDMSDADLAAQGFNKSEIKAIQAQAKSALNAATQVKTLSGVLDTAKEAAGSGWAQTWMIIFGNFGEARKLFTATSNAVNGFIQSSSNARNSVLKDWKALGGRTALINGIKNVFVALGAVLKPIKEAFRDIFPAVTGKQLADMTKKFEAFTAKLKIGPETAENLKRSFKGFFALLDIGKQVLGGIFTVFGKLFGAVTDGSGGFLNLTGSLGDFLVSVDASLKKGNKLHNFFVKLGEVLAAPVKLLAKIRDVIVGLFTGFDPSSANGLSNALGSMHDSLTPLGKVLDGVKKAWHNFLQSFGGVDKIVKPAMEAISGFFQGLGPIIADAVQNTDFSGVLEVIKVGLLGGIFLTMKKFFGGGFAKGIGGGVLGSISESFEALTGSLTALQTNIKAKTLQSIAIAVGILAASIIGLSLIDPKKLNTAMSAITIGLGQLLGSMAILSNISKSAGFVKLPLISAGLIGLSIALGLLTLAVRSLSGLSWAELAKGLGGVSVLLVGISAASGPLSKNSAGMISAGVGIAAIAVALKILASAVGDFGGLSWTQIGKGLASVAISLGAIGLASKLFPSGMIAIGLGLIGIATGLKILAGVVKTFGQMDMVTIAKGVGAVAASLVAIGLAMKLMPTGMIAQAAGLVLISAAILAISKAVESFGGMSIAELAKGLGALAISLGILAVALDAMTGTLAGAAALGVAAAGLALMAPAMKSLGRQSWGEIVKGLAALAGSLVLLGVAGVLLTPVAPALLALGVAMLAIGGGLALAGAGIALIGTGLSAIAISGPVAIGVLVKALISLVEAIPEVVDKFVNGLLTIVDHLAKTAPLFVVAIGKILVALSNAVVIASPLLANAFIALITAALKVLTDAAPQLVEAGFQLLIALLKGLKDHIANVVNMAADIVTTLLTTLAGKAGQIVAAGSKALASFLTGIANNLGKVISAGADIVVSIITGIGNNAGKIVKAGAQAVSSYIGAIGDAAASIIKAGANMVGNIISGIGDAVPKLVTKAGNAIGKFIDAVSDTAVGLVDKGAQAILNFLNGVDAAVKKYEPRIISAGATIAKDIVSGFVVAIRDSGGQIIGALGGIVGSAIDAAKKKLHIKSPSRVFYDIGTNVVQGLTNGLNDNGDSATAAVESMLNTMIASVSSLPDLGSVIDLEPTITPVLDLTNVQNGAKQLPGMLDPSAIDASTTQAAAIQAAQDAAQTPDETEPAQPGQSISLVQNNYSPEALTPVEIYRQTKNQISLLRNVVTTPTPA